MSERRDGHSMMVFDKEAKSIRVVDPHPPAQICAPETEPPRPQLVARIKRSSKYWGQTAPNHWFEIRVVRDTYYQLRGNNNNYRFVDVAMGIRFPDGVVIDFTNGKQVMARQPANPGT